MLVISAALIAFGADLLVDNATIVAKALGVSDAVIGLTIVTVGIVSILYDFSEMPSLKSNIGFYKIIEVLIKIDKKELISDIHDKLSVMSDNSENISSEQLGQLLFQVSALSAKADIDAEEALFKITNQFIDQFKD